MSWDWLRDVRFWLLLAAIMLLIGTLLSPRIRLTRQVIDVLAVVDITGSMNVRDMNVAGASASRLEAVQAALSGLLPELNCESRLGLAVFAERRTFLLFEPAEVCDNFAAIDSAIRNLDWRMSWEGDSHVARGVHRGIELAAGIRANIAFFTDGHEMPPLPGTGLPPFEGKVGEVQGLIIGVGGPSKSPIPKFDRDGRETGTWGPLDVPQANRSGPPPKDAETLPGYHPRYAPYGAAAAEGEEHVSSVRAEHLTAIAAQSGLAYLTLSDEPSLAAPLLAAARTRPVAIAADIRLYPAALALALLGLLFGILPLVALIGAMKSRPEQSIMRSPVP